MVRPQAVDRAMLTCARPRTLRSRLLIGLVLGVTLALCVTGAVLSRLFEQELEKQIGNELVRYLDRVTAQVTLVPDVPAVVNTQALTDPRWLQPYSGLYWQLSASDGSAALRSRSLWDVQLLVQAVAPGTASPQLTQTQGPQGQDLMVLSHPLQLPGQGGPSWTLSVALDHAELHSAAQSFNKTLVLALGVLLFLISTLGGAQLYVGLAPLRALQQGLQRLKQGQSNQLQGQYPAELQPLVDDFNQTLKQQSDAALLAREQAGNLAHGVKTPLSVMYQTAQNYPDHPLAEAVIEQVSQAKRQVDWHLAKSRAAAAHQQVHDASAVVPLIDSLVRAMQVVHAHRNLRLHWSAPGHGPVFLGASQDFQEMLGNLLDNACHWARANVWLTLDTPTPQVMVLSVDDDGPGLSHAEMEKATQRGIRLDERQSGSGLGLAISQDLALTYGGQIGLSDSPEGGLRAALTLPARAG